MSLTKTPPSMIDTTGATAGQVLTYNGSTSTWVASAAPQGTSTSGGFVQAFVNFDATRNVSGTSVTDNTNRFIRASSNVASVLRTGVGLYTVTFTTPMIDANYVVMGMLGIGSYTSVVNLNSIPALSGFTISTGTAYTPGALDYAHVHLVVVR